MVVIMALIVSNVACTSHGWFKGIAGFANDMSACIIPCNEITAITGRLVTDMLGKNVMLVAWYLRRGQRVIANPAINPRTYGATYRPAV